MPLGGLKVAWSARNENKIARPYAAVSNSHLHRRSPMHRVTKRVVLRSMSHDDELEIGTSRDRDIAQQNTRKEYKRYACCHVCDFSRL